MGFDMVKTMSCLLLALGSCAVSSMTWSIELSDDKRALIDQVLTQTHQSPSAVSQRLTERYSQQIFGIMSAQYPEVSDATMEQIEHDIEQIVKQYVVIEQHYSEQVYPVFEQQFTEQELTNILAFTHTEFGRKMLLALPVLLQQTHTASEEVELDLAPIINEHVLQLIAE
jgi:hypothetical protein